MLPEKRSISDLPADITDLRIVAQDNRNAPLPVLVRIRSRF